MAVGPLCGCCCRGERPWLVDGVEPAPEWSGLSLPESEGGSALTLEWGVGVGWG